MVFCAIECMSHWHPKITMQTPSIQTNSMKVKELSMCVAMNKINWISSFLLSTMTTTTTFYHNLLLFHVIYVIVSIAFGIWKWEEVQKKRRWRKKLWKNLNSSLLLSRFTGQNSTWNLYIHHIFVFRCVFVYMLNTCGVQRY